MMMKVRHLDHPYSMVEMDSYVHFAVDTHLLHHYGSDLAHLSDLYSLVIVMYTSEI